MKRKYLSPKTKVICIEHRGILMTSNITESIYTDDPQLPEAALAPIIDN